MRLEGITAPRMIAASLILVSSIFAGIYARDYICMAALSIYNEHRDLGIVMESLGVGWFIEMLLLVAGFTLYISLGLGLRLHVVARRFTLIYLLLLASLPFLALYMYWSSRLEYVREEAVKMVSAALAVLGVIELAIGFLLFLAAPKFLAGVSLYTYIRLGFKDVVIPVFLVGLVASALGAVLTLLLESTSLNAPLIPIPSDFTPMVRDMASLVSLKANYAISYLLTATPAYTIYLRIYGKAVDILPRSLS